MNRINRPDLDAQALQREYRCTVSDMPVNDAGLDGEDVQSAENRPRPRARPRARSQGRSEWSGGPLQITPGDYRAHLPRFQAENQAQNQKLIAALRTVAEQKGCSLAQLAIAWAFRRGTDIIPLIGARKVERLNEALGALQVELTAQDYDKIDREVPPGSIAGDRYAPEHMAMLDSER